jgi:hypothetical protein
MMKRLLLVFLLIMLTVGVYGCGVVDDSETLKLSGHVQLENGAPVPGVVVIFSWPDGGLLSRTTDSNGFYGYEYGEIFEDDPVTITPRSDTYTFSPPEYYLPSAGGGYGNLDFVAIENLSAGAQ